MSRVRRQVLACWLGVALALAGQASAQSDGDAEEKPELPARVSLVERFGVARLERRLASEDPEERLRAIERLGELGNAAALGRLTAYAFERRSQLGGREALTLARTLAPHAADAKVLLMLATLLNQSPSKAAGPEDAALAELARATAALALADEGSAGSLQVLGRALRSTGTPAALAADALLAHPPAALAPLLEAPGDPTPSLARLLGALGDQRAFHALRDWVRGGPVDVRAAAALALTQLGHVETVPLGALWLAEGPPELRRAGLEILLSAQDPRAEPALVAGLAARPPSPDERQLLLAAPSAALAPALLAREPADDAEASFRSSLLGRIGGPAALAELTRELSDEPRAFAAAHALSRLPGTAAHDTLARALHDGVAPALVLRAAAARTRAFAETYPELAARTRALAESSLPAERAAAAWVRGLSGGEAAAAELRSGDELRVLAAAASALLFDDVAIDAALEALVAVGNDSARVQSALGACLVAPRARARASSELLWSLVATSPAVRPLALRALAARDDPGLASGLGSYLDHPDPLLREHVARGLGESAREEAVGLLARRYAFETDEGVRRALVMALGAYRGSAAQRWLELAARLDPSPGVRSLARLGRSGVVLGDAVGSELLWVQLRTSPAASASAASEAPSAALASVAPGLTLPAFADPAGIVLVPGLPASGLGIRLQ